MTESLETTERSFARMLRTKLLPGLNKPVRASSVLVQFGNEKIVRVAQEIERYLLAHPQAADSAEGIAKWWLSRQRFEESLDLVQQALDLLAGQGRIVKVKNAGGTCIYKKHGN